MILYELTKSENHPAYQTLEISNGNRLHDFLRSLVLAALHLKKTFLSQTVIRALNYHAIACLHIHAGDYRPCAVTVGNYDPPEHYRVQALMDDFVNEVNLRWHSDDAVALAAYVLWRLNNIHPFINGNGRTARIACYYVLCLKAGGVISGTPTLPELIVQHRREYVAALRHADATAILAQLDLSQLHDLLTKLIEIQMCSAAEQNASATNDVQNLVSSD